jgi:hypothetical protein
MRFSAVSDLGDVKKGRAPFFDNLPIPPTGTRKQRRG